MLKNNILILRALEPEDVDILYQWENDMQMWNVSDTLTPFSKYILNQYIQNSHLDIFQLKELRLVVELIETKKPIGLIDLFDFDPYHSRAGVGILIYSGEDRKKGLASSALDLFINYAFRTLGLHQLYCNIAADNQISLKLFQSYGFEIIGVKKDWRKSTNGWVDEYVLQLINF
jgi:diamine N-acetyltransferase